MEENDRSTKIINKQLVYIPAKFVSHAVPRADEEVYLHNSDQTATSNIKIRCECACV